MPKPISIEDALKGHGSILPGYDEATPGQKAAMTRKVREQRRWKERREQAEYMYRAALSVVEGKPSFIVASGKLLELFYRVMELRHAEGRRLENGGFPSAVQVENNSRDQRQEVVGMVGEGLIDVHPTEQFSQEYRLYFESDDALVTFRLKHGA